MADVKRFWQHGYRTGGASLVDVKTVGRSRRVHTQTEFLNPTRRMSLRSLRARMIFPANRQ